MPDVTHALFELGDTWYDDEGYYIVIAICFDSNDAKILSEAHTDCKVVTCDNDPYYYVVEEA